MFFTTVTASEPHRILSVSTPMLLAPMRNTLMVSGLGAAALITSALKVIVNSVVSAATSVVPRAGEKAVGTGVPGKGEVVKEYPVVKPGKRRPVVLDTKHVSSTVTEYLKPFCRRRPPANTLGSRIMSTRCPTRCTRPGTLASLETSMTATGAARPSRKMVTKPVFKSTGCEKRSEILRVRSASTVVDMCCGMDSAGLNSGTLAPATQ
mmetsp:Transcript_3804/g.8967  ORF Transcript_3804/g.8967 Transcript_3804/m.8967 type:complete len:208 (-) Transcript_3804:7477-8100(-)